MTDWTTLPLAEVLEFREGPGILAKDFHDEGVPLIRLAGLKSGASILKGCNYLDPDLVASKWNHFRTKAGDVLLSTSASLGEVAVVNGEGEGAVPYTGIIAFRPKADDVDRSFIPFLLTAPSFKAQIEAMGVGSVMKHFGPMHLRKMKVSFPDVRQQRAIAEVLGALDDKIAANTKLAETADDFLSTKFAGLISAFPEMQPLGTVADVNRTTIKPTRGGSLRYVDIASVGVGHYDFPELSLWDEAPSRARRALGRGDTIWSTVRPNRRSHALILSDDPHLVGSTGLAVLSPREVGFAFLYEVTKRPEFTAYLETVAEGSAYPAVRADKFLDAPVPRLPVATRERFEAEASALRLHVESLIEENRTLAATRETLLPQLMSGKLRVKDIETTMGEMV